MLKIYSYILRLLELSIAWGEAPEKGAIWTGWVLKAQGHYTKESFIGRKLLFEN